MTATTLTPPAPVKQETGPEISVSQTRSISRLEEFRCQAPTRVNTGIDATVNRCLAESYVKVTYPHDIERFMCAHHATERWENILKVAVKVLDERPAIRTQASAAAY